MAKFFHAESVRVAAVTDNSTFSVCAYDRQREPMGYYAFAPIQSEAMLLQTLIADVASLKDTVELWAKKTAAAPVVVNYAPMRRTKAATKVRKAKAKP